MAHVDPLIQIVPEEETNNPLRLPFFITGHIDPIDWNNPEKAIEQLKVIHEDMKILFPRLEEFEMKVLDYVLDTHQDLLGKGESLFRFYKSLQVTP